MDRAERLIANRGNLRIWLLWGILLLLAALCAGVLSGLLADRIVTEQIRAVLGYAGGAAITDAPTAEAVRSGEALIGQFGVYADMSPRLIERYSAIRTQLFWAIFAASGLLLTLSAFLAYRSTDRIFTDLDAIYADCMRMETQPAHFLTTRGDDMDSVRRVCDGIRHVANYAMHAAEVNAREHRQLQETLTDFSHQMKGALAIIRLNRDMLDGLPLPQEERERLSAEITQHLDGMEQLVLQMLRLARLEASAVIYDFSEQDLAATCRLAGERVGALLRAKQIRLTVQGEPDAVMPHDRVWFCEAIENLLKNAADHADCRSVEIEIRALPSAIRLTVTDDGRGIPFAKLRRVFDRFQPHGGDPCNTGVGMAIAKQVISAHGGTVSVYSGPGGGTQFFIMFLRSGAARDEKAPGS